MRLPRREAVFLSKRPPAACGERAWRGVAVAGGRPRAGFAAPGRGQGLPEGGGLAAARLAEVPGFPASGAGVPCQLRSRGRPAKGGAPVTGLRSSGSRDGGRCGVSQWVRVSPLRGQPGGDALVTRSGLRAAGPAAAAGAVETRLPDDALTLPNGAAARSARRPAVPPLSSLPSPSAALCCSAKPAEAPFPRSWLMVNVF